MNRVKDVGSSKDLFDDELKELLKNAESRLRTSATKPSQDGPEHERSLQHLRLNNPLASTNLNGVRGSIQSGKKTNSPEIAAPRKPEPSTKAKKQANKKRKAASAGDEWYNLPKTRLDPTTKRDLQLLQMRNVLDPHRHYRKTEQRGKLPQYSQMGTVVEGPTEYFSARLNNKDRTQSLAGDLLSGESSMNRFKNKYADIQAKSTSGRKAHYKAVKAKRARRN